VQHIAHAHRFIKEDYLQQNSFTKYDKYCPFYKSVEMMRNICAFHRLATGELWVAGWPCNKLLPAVVVVRRCCNAGVGTATRVGGVYPTSQVVFVVTACKCV
jgi:vacuolar-type H+-ATPase catalytic subunit A/Vma1